MCRIPGGKFPVKDVETEIATFFLDQHEVSRGQFAAFEGKPTTDARLPAANITWDRAREYCAWAGKRIPTDEEWVYAAFWDPPARRFRVYPWGDEHPAGHANCRNVECGDQYEDAAPVDAFGPQGLYGLMNMWGNVEEWIDKKHWARGATYLSGADYEPRFVYGKWQMKYLIEPPGEDVGFRCAISAPAPASER